MRISGTLCFALLLLTGAPASAQVLDLSTIKCKDFFEGSKESIGYTLAWLDAYYRDEDDPPIIDFDKMTKNAEQLGAYCAANPTVGLITAADKLFDK
jgi:acid stress chaperone HdeB